MKKQIFFCIIYYKLKIMSEEKKCKKCSKTSSYKHIGVIVLGTYVLFATIYGSIELFKDLISLFK